jgi:hypothetical protein
MRDTLKYRMMKHITLMIITLLVLFGEATAQEEKKFTRDKNWATLAKVSYKMVTDQYGEMSVPEFSTDVQSLDGKPLELTGYIVPLDGLEGAFRPTHFLLSSLPLSACFFCGTGGPESVVEVQLAAPVEYTTDPITIKGTLKLNAYDPYQMMYILEESELVEIVN